MSAPVMTHVAVTSLTLLKTPEWLCIEMLVLWHALLKTPEWLCIEMLMARLIKDSGMAVH